VTDFAVLAGSTITNTGPTTVAGNVGVHPGSAITGFPPGTVVDGAIHSADTVCAQAQADAATLYDDLAGRRDSVELTGLDLGGLRLPPGVYRFGSSAQLTGTLTLDARGDDEATFVFQIGSTLTTASASHVALTNGGRVHNVFWLVGSSATLGTGTHLLGRIVALTSITATTGVRVTGQLVARHGAVTLDSNVIRLCD